MYKLFPRACKWVAVRPRASDQIIQAQVHCHTELMTQDDGNRKLKIKTNNNSLQMGDSHKLTHRAEDPTNNKQK